jgi:hypothetical protein
MIKLFDWRAHLFPLMSPAELKELAEDIKAHGQTTAIMMWPDSNQKLLLIDGRNRLDALALLGLIGVDKSGCLTLKTTRPNDRCEFECAPHIDPYALALSLNVHRRHLTPEQKRTLIAKVLKARPEQSDRQIAEQAKVDHKTVGKVRAEKEATGEIPQLKKTTGKDGKSRPKPTKKAKPAAAADDADASAAAMKAKHAERAEQAKRATEWMKRETERIKERIKQGGASFTHEFFNGGTREYNEDRQAEYDLAIRMIDAGYRTMAKVNHPDVGGSKDMMARLNRVRDRLKELAERGMS